MKPAKRVIVEPLDVAGMLGDLGLDEPSLRRAIDMGHAWRATATENDPPGFSGIMGWGRTVRALRDILIPQGWFRSNKNHLATVVCPDGSFQIYVVMGDDGTGDPKRHPNPIREKGPATIRAAEENLQEILSPAWLPPEERAPSRASILTRFLLVHVAREEIRAELSIPLEFAADDYIEQWEERIILTSIPLDGSPNRLPDQGPPPSADDIDVAVHRRR